ncbi:hypothetical protein [Streptomyces cyanogenus]|uniref:Uncharacterized protein n=1 Tax=Streptomyces cyanogenus TaxID=80860 RepID=A0ABX7TSG5_STRCY|nr:hypothetical protein [Streptomyces cyanogenus]QTD98250.1 hypothetical protein S1361_12885 [Streptomyces cyanogenus]
MQVEIVSALIGAAVALPAAAAAYAVGRHQAVATISAAHAQVDGSHKQWRDGTRRSAWLAFIRSADELDRAAARLARGTASYDAALHDAIADLDIKLADVEFEGPATIAACGERLRNALFGQLIFSATLGSFVGVQKRFDEALARSRQEVAIAISGEPPVGALRVIEAHQTLENLSNERPAIAATPPSNDIMELAMMVFSPFIQSGGREHRESLTMIAQGVAAIAASAMTATPELFVHATRKLQECRIFDQREVGGIVFNYASGVIPYFEVHVARMREISLALRSEFLRESDKHLDAPLPVTR